MRPSRLIVGAGAAFAPRRWARGLAPSRRLLVVSEPQVAGRFSARLRRALVREGFSAAAHLLPRGERAKAWPAVESLLRAMAAARLGRDGALVALGGGAVTDAAGFAAAIYLRGIPWASVPSSLLGQLDSGLGGKTGINLGGLKNRVGAFHQPAVVVCDPSLLDSLPPRERVSGLAEALKIALVFDPALWRRLRARWAALAEGERAETARLIRKVGAWKLRVVAEDERETKDRRILLNFGHTLGHALESAAGLGRLRHGEAVLWGMRAALKLSRERAGLPEREFAEADAFLAAIAPPLPPLELRRVLALAASDKKSRAGRVRWVLLRRIGRPLIAPVPEPSARRALAELLSPRAAPAGAALR